MVINCLIVVYVVRELLSVYVLIVGLLYFVIMIVLKMEVIEVNIFKVMRMLMRMFFWSGFFSFQRNMIGVKESNILLLMLIVELRFDMM